MGRKSALTESQWAEVERKLLTGGKVRALAREFGVSPSIISARFSGRSEKIKIVAKQVIAADEAFNGLSFSEQAAAKSLIDELRSVSVHLAGSAKFGAMTAHRLSGIAHQQVDRLNDADPMDDASMETLRGIAAYTEVANKSAQIGFGLLAANKQIPPDPSGDEGTPQPEALGAVFDRAMEWASNQFQAVIERVDEFRENDPFADDEREAG